MSYQKKTNIAPSIPDSIRFYYSQDEIFNRDSLETLFLAKQMKDDKGAAKVDDYAITEDERNIFQSLLDKAVLDIYSVFMKYTKGIPKVDTFDTDVMESTTSVDTSDDYVEFEIRDNSAYKVSILKWVDRQIKEMLILHVKSGWYDIVGLSDLEGKYFAKYQMAKSELINKGLIDLLKVSI